MRMLLATVMGMTLWLTAQAAELPSRGMTMDAVQAAYGAPTSRTEAVGHPPITRWMYPNFTIYFQNNYVVRAVPVPVVTAPSAQDNAQPAPTTNP